MSRKLIVFGAGNNGLKFLEKYGKEDILCFCDNNVKKHNSVIDGIQILSFAEMVELYDSNSHIIVVTPSDNTLITGQLEQAGITEYFQFKEKNDKNVLDLLTEDEKKYSKQNMLLDKYAKDCKELDLIEDGLSVREVVKEVLDKYKKGLQLLHFGIGEEGNFYGNLDTLLGFAECLDFDRVYAPNISHNAIKPLRVTETMFERATIVSGRYYHERIHKWRPYVPVFVVGPYIQYSDGIYDSITVKKMKSKNGHTITVFLPHSIENISRKYDKKAFIDLVLSKYKNEYDTINLCVYWADLLDQCCDYAADKGINIVTAGFRFDRLFNRRLKTILELSDVVSGGDFGTHYIYGLTLNKKVCRVDITDNTAIIDVEFGSKLEHEVMFDGVYRDYLVDFYKLFTSTPELSPAQIEWCRPFSGIGITRSREYIKNIFSISKDILVECEGIQSDYSRAVRSIFEKYCRDGDFEKMSILADALGNYAYYQ